MADKKDKVIRKPDPSKRKNIQVATFKKVEDFLNDQESPIFMSEVVKQLSVDYNSLKVACNMLDVRYDDEGRIFLEKKEGGKK